MKKTILSLTAILAIQAFGKGNFGFDFTYSNKLLADAYINSTYIDGSVAKDNYKLSIHSDMNKDLFGGIKGSYIGKEIKVGTFMGGNTHNFTLSGGLGLRVNLDFKNDLYNPEPKYEIRKETTKQKPKPTTPHTPTDEDKFRSTVSSILSKIDTSDLVSSVNEIFNIIKNKFPEIRLGFRPIARTSNYGGMVIIKLDEFTPINLNGKYDYKFSFDEIYNMAKNDSQKEILKKIPENRANELIKEIENKYWDSLKKKLLSHPFNELLTFENIKKIANIPSVGFAPLRNNENKMERKIDRVIPLYFELNGKYENDLVKFELNNEVDYEEVAAHAKKDKGTTKSTRGKTIEQDTFDGDAFTRNIKYKLGELAAYKIDKEYEIGQKLNYELTYSKQFGNIKEISDYSPLKNIKFISFDLSGSSLPLPPVNINLLQKGKYESTTFENTVNPSIYIKKTKIVDNTILEPMLDISGLYYNFKKVRTNDTLMFNSEISKPEKIDFSYYNLSLNPSLKLGYMFAKKDALVYTKLSGSLIFDKYKLDGKDKFGFNTGTYKIEGGFKYTW